MNAPQVCGVALLTLLVWAAPVRAQTFEGTAFAGVGFFLNDLVDEEEARIGLDDSFVVGAHAGLRFGRILGVEGTFAFVPTELPATDGGLTIGEDTDLRIYGASLLLNVPVPASPLEPFAALGLGAKTYAPEEGESETDFMWSLGAGARLFFGDHVAIRLEARNYMSSFDPPDPTFDSSLQNDLLLTGGLSLLFP